MINCSANRYGYKFKTTNPTNVQFSGKNIWSETNWPFIKFIILSGYLYICLIKLINLFLGWIVRQILGSGCSIHWSYAVTYFDSVSCSDWSNSNHFSFHVFGVQNTVSWTNWIDYPDYYPTRIYRNVFG